MRKFDVSQIRTARLRGRAIGRDDFANQFRLHGDPAVAATLGGVRDAAWVHESLAELQTHWDEHGFGLWMFFDPETDTFVGRAGLLVADFGPVRELALAYALVPSAWGRGLATELARACVDVAFDVLRWSSVVAFTLPHNHASRRVMEKLGMSCAGPIVWKGLDHILYRLGRPAE